jgi:pilus assembly protein Flp/PilA
MRPEKPSESLLQRFVSCESGHTAIEYGLIMALIFLVIVGAVTHFSEAATSKMQAANDAIAAAGS